jgi:hypothetical protein
MRKLVLALVLLCVPATASAEIGLGVFLGQPTGFDVKIDLQRRSALDIVIGVTGFHRDSRFYRTDYGHLTYLVTPFVGRGSSVLVPLRIGIGVAAYGLFDDDINVAARVPFEVALLFRRAPLEIYGEVALKLVMVDENDNDDFLDADGGIGLRFYF